MPTPSDLQVRRGVEPVLLAAPPAGGTPRLSSPDSHGGMATPQMSHDDAHQREGSTTSAAASASGGTGVGKSAHSPAQPPLPKSLEAWQNQPISLSRSGPPASTKSSTGGDRNHQSSSSPVRGRAEKRPALTPSHDDLADLVTPRDHQPIVSGTSVASSSSRVAKGQQDAASAHGAQLSAAPTPRDQSSSPMFVPISPGAGSTASGTAAHRPSGPGGSGSSYTLGGHAPSSSHPSPRGMGTPQHSTPPHGAVPAPTGSSSHPKQPSGSATQQQQQSPRVAMLPLPLPADANAAVSPRAVQNGSMASTTAANANTPRSHQPNSGRVRSGSQPPHLQWNGQSGSSLPPLSARSGQGSHVATPRGSSNNAPPSPSPFNPMNPASSGSQPHGSLTASQRQQLPPGAHVGSGGSQQYVGASTPRSSPGACAALEPFPQRPPSAAGSQPSSQPPSRARSNSYGRRSATGYPDDDHGVEMHDMNDTDEVREMRELGLYRRPTPRVTEEWDGASSAVGHSLSSLNAGGGGGGEIVGGGSLHLHLGNAPPSGAGDVISGSVRSAQSSMSGAMRGGASVRAIGSARTTPRSRLLSAGPGDEQPVFYDHMNARQLVEGASAVPTAVRVHGDGRVSPAGQPTGPAHDLLTHGSAAAACLPNGGASSSGRGGGGGGGFASPNGAASVLSLSSRAMERSRRGSCVADSLATSAAPSPIRGSVREGSTRNNGRSSEREDSEPVEAKRDRTMFAAAAKLIESLSRNPSRAQSRRASVQQPALQPVQVQAGAGTSARASSGRASPTSVHAAPPVAPHPSHSPAYLSLEGSVRGDASVRNDNGRLAMVPSSVDAGGGGGASPRGAGSAGQSGRHLGGPGTTGFDTFVSTSTLPPGNSPRPSRHAGKSPSAWRGHHRREMSAFSAVSAADLSATLNPDSPQQDLGDGDGHDQFESADMPFVSQTTRADVSQSTAHHFSRGVDGVSPPFPDDGSAHELRRRLHAYRDAFASGGDCNGTELDSTNNLVPIRSGTTDMDDALFTSHDVTFESQRTLHGAGYGMSAGGYPAGHGHGGPSAHSAAAMGAVQSGGYLHLPVHPSAASRRASAMGRRESYGDRESAEHPISGRDSGRSRSFSPSAQSPIARPQPVRAGSVSGAGAAMSTPPRRGLSLPQWDAVPAGVERWEAETIPPSTPDVVLAREAEAADAAADHAINGDDRGAVAGGAASSVTPRTAISVVSDGGRSSALTGRTGRSKDRVSFGSGLIGGELRDWAQGICGCDTAQCLEVTFCMTCQLGRQWSAVAHGASDTFATTFCVGSVLLAPLLPCFIALIRAEVRDRFGIHETKIGSLCTSCLCPCCSVCQTGGQLEASGVPAGFSCGASKKFRPAPAAPELTQRMI